VWPLTARAQQRPLPVVGYLNTRAADQDPFLLAAFRQGLTEAGYFEGQNVTIIYRWAEGHSDRLPALADDLVRRQVNVIAVNGGGIIAARAATTTIPIVFITATDPVRVGFVASLNRPGGNLTGVTTLDVELGAKRLQLLHEVIPNATTVAALINPNSPESDLQVRDLQSGARRLGLQIHILYASTLREIETAFASLVDLRASGLVVAGDPYFTAWSDHLATLALRHAVPAIYEYRMFAASGGLMSYGDRLADVYRLLGIYAGRILVGDKPADLPVQQSTKIELLINVKTAKALGLTIPETLLATADEVIE
jgi:putative ABC transport system substrate-binding protein